MKVKELLKLQDEMEQRNRERVEAFTKEQNERRNEQ